MKSLCFRSTKIDPTGTIAQLVIVFDSCPRGHDSIPIRPLSSWVVPFWKTPTFRIFEEISLLLISRNNIWEIVHLLIFSRNRQTASLGQFLLWQGCRIRSQCQKYALAAFSTMFKLWINPLHHPEMSRIY